jgi:hypothetical protein
VGFSASVGAGGGAGADGGAGGGAVPRALPAADGGGTVPRAASGAIRAASRRACEVATAGGGVADDGPADAAGSAGFESVGFDSVDGVSPLPAGGDPGVAAAVADGDCGSEDAGVEGAGVNADCDAGVDPPTNLVSAKPMPASATIASAPTPSASELRPLFTTGAGCCAPTASGMGTAGVGGFGAAAGAAAGDGTGTGVAAAAAAAGADEGAGTFAGGVGTARAAVCVDPIVRCGAPIGSVAASETDAALPSRDTAAAIACAISSAL